MTKQTFVLVHETARKRALAAVTTAPDGFVTVVCEPTRNLDQNAAQWPILQAFSDQLVWPVNGKMETLTPEEWKAILSAAFYKEVTRLATGLDGGIVMLGQRTSKMSKSTFSEWLEFLHATAAMKGIVIYNDGHEDT